MSEKNVEVMELIETLYSMVTEAWGVPLGNDKCIVERENVLEILNEIKTRIPVELAEAKRLVSARDEFIGNAKREAESIRKNAEDKARAMLEEPGDSARCQSSTAQSLCPMPSISQRNCAELQTSMSMRFSAARKKRSARRSNRSISRVQASAASQARQRRLSR